MYIEWISAKHLSLNVPKIQVALLICRAIEKCSFEKLPAWFPFDPRDFFLSADKKLIVAFRLHHPKKKFQVFDFEPQFIFKYFKICQKEFVSATQVLVITVPYVHFRLHNNYQNLNIVKKNGHWGSPRWVPPQPLITESLEKKGSLANCMLSVHTCKTLEKIQDCLQAWTVCWHGWMRVWNWW